MVATKASTLQRQQYEDAVYSTLLAQLASDKKQGHKDPLEWYKNYTEVTSNVGWVVEGSTSFAKFDQQADKVNLSTVVLESLRQSGKLTAARKGRGHGAERRLVQSSSKCSG